jgi:hypothetical protein
MTTDTTREERALSAEEYLQEHIKLMGRVSPEQWDKADRALMAALEWLGGPVADFTQEQHVMLKRAALVILAAFALEQP